MRISLENLSIAQRLLGLFLINISIVIVIITNGYNFTNTSVDNLQYIEEKSLPISSLHIQNLYLLESIMGSFTDAAVTNEKDILLNTIKLKEQLQKNITQLESYGINIEDGKKYFERYFDFAYSFTISILKDSKNFQLKDATILQQYSSEVLVLFKEEKQNSKDTLSHSLADISTQTSHFFTSSIILSSIGLFIMFFLGLYMYKLVNTRFTTILTSIENLTLEEPDFSTRLESVHNDEIGKLIQLFNKLEDKLEIIYNDSSKAFLKEIADTQKEVIFTMGSIAESRSKETGNHVKRVAEYSYLLAKYYGLPEEECSMLKRASPMHDIGKVAIPDYILNKPGRFDDKERAIMDTHAQLGHDMLQASTRPLLKTAAIVAIQHHEKWDGTGYPNAKKGEDIHIFGRITALADVFDALGSHRVYKIAWDDERIFNFFKEERGKHFDPKLIDIFFNNLEYFLDIRDSFKD